MQRILFAATAVIAVAACEPEAKKQTNEVERIEKYTAQDTAQHSRPQIRYYGECESKLRPIEKDIKVLHEREKAGMVLTPGKQAALTALEALIPAARAKVNELYKVGAGDWEDLKPSVEEAIGAVQKQYATLNETP